MNYMYLFLIIKGRYIILLNEGLIWVGVMGYLL